jgi:hypothetical protein
MSEKNSKLLLPFPTDKLSEDMERQRNHIENNMNFKEDFLKTIESKNMLFKNNADTGDEEVNGDVLNAIMNLNDNIDSSFKILMDSYSKLAMSSSTMEKAFKENNFEVKTKENKPTKPIGKSGLF